MKLPYNFMAHIHARQLALAACLLFFYSTEGKSQNYLIGADLSFMKQTEDRGFVFKENGQAKSCLQIFKDHGYNWVRLRLFHTPKDLPNSIGYTIAAAKQAKKMGFRFLLDFHYSDTWADPQKQFLPKAWEGLSHSDLVKAVFEYTRNSMTVFRDTGAFPDMVEVGNEIINGMLWPDGKLPENWSNFAELVQAGISGVYASCENIPYPKIMIHIDQGGNKNNTKYFFDKLNSYGVRYDIIGQSYYPWWHGSLLDLRENLNFTALEYGKDIIVVEAAYNWKPKEYISKNAPFPESPEGQKDFLEEVNRVVMSVVNNRGIGVFWWEPAVNRGSRGFFDETGNVLPVITVFDKFTRK
jgi:arabinogalactan endo-1,4-beta-galactosidase